MLASQPTLVRQEQRRAQAALDARPSLLEEAQAVYRVEGEARSGEGRLAEGRSRSSRQVAEVQKAAAQLGSGLDRWHDPNRWDRRLKAAAEGRQIRTGGAPSTLDSAIVKLGLRNAPGNLAQIMAVAIPVGLGTAAQSGCAVKAAQYPGRWSTRPRSRCLILERYIRTTRSWSLVVLPQHSRPPITWPGSRAATVPRRKP